MLHSLTNIERQKHCQNKSRFNEVYSRDNLLRNIKERAYVITLDKYFDFGTHWVGLYISNDAIYFDSFGVEQISKGTKKLLEKKPQHI